MKPLDRRQFLKTSLVLGSVLSSPFPVAFADDPKFRFEPEESAILAPSDPALWPEFRRQLAAWRDQKRQELNYSNALYRREDFQWTSSSFACCFLMLCDERFYDAKTGRYMVAQFLEQARQDFGGFDSIVLWHAYPRIGFDDRNQFDFYRDQPDGLKGLRAVVDDLHHEGLKVFIDYNPWDTGTRREGKDDLDALADMIAALQADGIFLDTMSSGAAAFRAKLDAVRLGVVLESEDALPLDRIYDNHMSWAQWFADSHAPAVLRNKWFERRHMQHQIQRWNSDHSAELQAAWMNGSGILIWENVFGTWNGWRPRDQSFLRAMLPIQRRFAALFAGERWTPLTPVLLPDVYASLWEGEELRLWTVINRSQESRDGALMKIELREGERIFDLVAGREAVMRAPDEVHVSLRPDGLACLLAATPKALGGDFEEFLNRQRAETIRCNWDATPPELHAVLERVLATRAYRQSSMPAGMAAIPATSFQFKSEFRIRECGFYDSIDPWFAHQSPPLHSPITFSREVTLKAYAIDLTPVTNAHFAEFLKASGYQPRELRHFLKHWIQGAPPPGKEDHPVVHVDVDDARAYAHWNGKRLPTEEEWQYAAQGLDGRKYPWGSAMTSGRCNDGKTGGTTAVRAFPDGRSPFGLYDLCGNVWQWTESERSDGRTRFCIVRGGSFYQARGSEWYADGGPQPCRFAAKFLLMWPGLDRCGTIGFRCAADLEIAG